MTKAIQLKPIAVALGAVALAITGIWAVQNVRSLTLGSTPILEAVAVTLQDGRTLNVQRREVTVSQWQACHTDGYCTLDLSTRDATTDFPATGLSYPDAMEFMVWINHVGDAEWRLPTADEWHDLAAEVMPEKPDPIFTDPSLTWASTYLTQANQTGRALRPSGAFSATAAGIEDLDGNVWEWTMDCYAGSGGQARVERTDRCPAFIMGGEHQAVMSYLVRDPARGGCAVGTPPAHLGMRLVSDVT